MFCVKAALIAAVVGLASPARAADPADLKICPAPPLECRVIDEPICPIQDGLDALPLPPPPPPLEGRWAICPKLDGKPGPSCDDPLVGFASLGAPAREPSSAGGARPTTGMPDADEGPYLVVAPWFSTDEHQAFELEVESDLRVFAFDLPPGAAFRDHRLVWTPDFLQGGRDWVVHFLATDGATTLRAQTTIQVRDTVHPPAPVVVDQQDVGEHIILTVHQMTDSFLDSPGFAGRRFVAKVVIPDRIPPHPYPVQLSLHGFNGKPEPQPFGPQIRIYPHDPKNTYWWGYASTLPRRRPARSVPNYTQRRALHLVDWVLRTQRHADPERVYVAGESMGGAGALALGLLYGRHFAAIEATLGQVVARNHRPRRIAQLQKLWGRPRRNLPDGDAVSPMGVWDRLDLVRAMIERTEARHQFIFTHHAKDDPVIHFGAVVHPSRATGLAFYDALQQLRIGHYVVWDEGGHGVPDPVLDTGWWDRDWNRMTDPETFLRRNLAFPAFSRSSADNDPGAGDSNGTRKWNVDRGYAGRYTVPGDTGWTGDRAGVRNRYLRWDSRTIVDRWDRFEISLRLETGPGEAPPGPDYPPLGDRLDAPLPITVDVTPRRVQAFRCRPGERIEWAFGGQEGLAVADADGSVTLERLALVPMYERLILTRADPALGRPQAQ